MDSGCLRQQRKEDCNNWLQKKKKRTSIKATWDGRKSIGDWITGLGWGWLERHGTQIAAEQEVFARSSACLLRTWQHLNEESRKYWAGPEVM